MQEIDPPRPPPTSDPCPSLRPSLSYRVLALSRFLSSGDLRDAVSVTRTRTARRSSLFAVSPGVNLRLDAATPCSVARTRAHGSVAEIYVWIHAESCTKEPGYTCRTWVYEGVTVVEGWFMQKCVCYLDTRKGMRTAPRTRPIPLSFSAHPRVFSPLAPL